MKAFLREIFELLYWAIFCPSKLQKRKENWTRQEDINAAPDDSTRLSYNYSFWMQFSCLICLSSLPLFVSTIASSSLLSWILFPVSLLIAYGMAVIALPVALYIPLLVYLVCGSEPTIVGENSWLVLQEFRGLIPDALQKLSGIALALIMIGISSAVTNVLVKWGHQTVARDSVSLGSLVVVLIGCWFNTQSLTYTFLLGITFILLSYFLKDLMKDLMQGHAESINTDATNTIVNSTGAITYATAIVVVGISIVATSDMNTAIIGGVLTGIVASTLANGTFTGAADVTEIAGALIASAIILAFASATLAVTTGMIVSASQLPLTTFLLMTALIALIFSYTRQQNLGWILGLILIGLGVKQLGWSAFYALPVTIAFYYRIIPEYIFFAIWRFSAAFSLLNRTSSGSQNAQTYKSQLTQLPPFSSELLWFPIPGHETLIAKVFQTQPSFGLEALQMMQTSSLPGLQRTAQKSLPLIVTDYLSAFKDILSLNQLNIPTKKRAEEAQPEELLTILLPNFYNLPSDEIGDDSSLPNAELSAVLPRMRNIAQDSGAALQATNLALKERGLENVLKRLGTLLSQLSSLGLTSTAIERWSNVIHQWQRIVEQELERQNNLSQGELLNPFQYGNPLQRNRTDLFKGRQFFAENIARILLDRNRPTIILHGPRRCGKTSFLNNLPRLLPSQWIPVFIDAQSAATTTDEAGFCQSLVRAIIRDGRAQGLKFPTSPTRAEFQSAPYLVLEDWLQEALDNLTEEGQDKRLLLTIDEFEKIGTALDAGKLNLALFDELRSLIQHWEQLGFVFSGVQTLDELGPNWSSYFISVVPVEMLYLEPSEARSLLTNPDPDFALTYAPDLIDEILHLTQCHPNLLQLIGAALVTEANERHTTTATADMLQAAIPRAFTLGTSYFTNVWTEFTGNPANPAEVHTGQTLLKALANGTQPASGDDAHTHSLSKAALRRMERYHVLKRIEGQYEFDIPLIQRWVKERAILE